MSLQSLPDQPLIDESPTISRVPRTCLFRKQKTTSSKSSSCTEVLLASHRLEVGVQRRRLQCSIPDALCIFLSLSLSSPADTRCQEGQGEQEQSLARTRRSELVLCGLICLADHRPPSE